MHTPAASSLHVGLVVSECRPIFRTWYKRLSTTLDVTVDNDLQTFLEAVLLFSTIPRAQLQGLAAIFEPISAAKGAVLCREGEPGDATYIIKSGAVDRGLPCAHGRHQTEDREQN